MRKPLGPKDMDCPHWQKPMSKVCHRCPFWIALRGTNTNTGDPVDEWMCAFASLPMLLVETAQQSRQNGAATESMRNEMVRLASRPRAPIMIEGQ